MTKQSLSRRRFVGTGAAATGSLALGLQGTRGRVSPAAAQGQQLEGTIVISTIQNPDDQAKQALTDAYNEQQPGVEIVWETQDTQAGEYSTYLGTLLAASDVRPDIVSGNYVSTFRGYVNLERYRRQTNPYTGNPWDVDVDWDFYRGTNAAGERIMLPTRSVHINWFYNKDIFSEVGIQPPTTWEQFTEVSAALAEAGHTPIVANYDYQVPQWFAEVYFDQFHTHWIETVRAKPGDWNYIPELDDAFVYNPENPNLHNTYTYNVQRFYKGIADGELRFDTPEVAAIAENMGQVFPRYATSDFFVVQDPYPIFLQQQAAIMPSGTWAFGNLKNDLESLSPERLEDLEIDADSVSTFEWGIFENPSMEGDLVRSPVRSVESATGEYLSIVEKSQEQTDLTIDFLMFWASPAGYQPYLDAQFAAGGFSPSGPLEVQGVDQPPELVELFETVTLLGNAEINYNGFWTSGGGGNLRQDLRGLFQDALEGDLAPDEYASRLQEYITENLDDFLERADLTRDDIEDPARQPGT
ncbi:MAG: ABC transporter substrate-binding protein [Thermomicrobiales bacterium]